MLYIFALKVLTPHYGQGARVRYSVTIMNLNGGKNFPEQADRYLLVCIDGSITISF